MLKKFVGQSNILTAPVAFVKYTGSLDCAVFLSQIIYWTDRSSDGWFYKSYAEWESEICLSEYEIRKNCRRLKNKGILVTKLQKVNGAPVVHYRLNEAVFSESILKFLKNPICTNSRNLDTEKTSESINKDYLRLQTEPADAAPVETVGEYLNRILRETGLTRIEVSERAEQCGYRLSASFVHECANGMAKNPSAQTVRALAAGLDRPPEEVFNVFQVFNPPFSGKEFLEALAAYDRTAKQRRVKESPEQRRLLFKRLAQWGEIAATKALEDAVTNSWRGVFEPKGFNNGAGQHEAPEPRRTPTLREQIAAREAAR